MAEEAEIRMRPAGGPAAEGSLGAAGMLPLCGGDGRVDEGEGARREGNLAWADTEESAELSKLGPPLARDEVGCWVAIAVEVCDRQQKEQRFPLGGGTEVVVDLLHDLCVGGARWEGER